MDRQEADPRGKEGEGQDCQGRILGPDRRSEGINIWRLLFLIIMQSKPPLSKYIRLNNSFVFSLFENFQIVDAVGLY